MPEQRQDSLSEQMVTVIQLAQEAGCYDAVDWIAKMFGPRLDLPPSAGALALYRFTSHDRSCRRRDFDSCDCGLTQAASEAFG